MLKSIALFFSLFIPIAALAEVEPINNAAGTASVDGTDIAPTSITTGVGSFSGSVTASSVTSQGGYLGGGLMNLDYANPAYQLQGQSVLSRNSGTGAVTLNTGSSAWPLELQSSGGSVGIGTASPCSTCTLHVAGGASVTGAFAVASATFTVATTGIVSAPSQPGASLYLDANMTSAAGTQTDIYWSYANNFGSWHTGGVFDATGSSNTFTAPADGKYSMSFCPKFSVTGASYVYAIIRNPGSTQWNVAASPAPTFTGEQTICAGGTFKMTVGQQLVATMQSDATVTVISGAGNSRVTFEKER